MKTKISLFDSDNYSTITYNTSFIQEIYNISKIYFVNDSNYVQKQSYQNIFMYGYAFYPYHIKYTPSLHIFYVMPSFNLVLSKMKHLCFKMNY